MWKYRPASVLPSGVTGNDIRRNRTVPQRHNDAPTHIALGMVAELVRADLPGLQMA